uniref:hypothetical protein n=1 Tax=Prevotella sp. TaxID=59823 RepID=UPI004028DA4B
YQDRNQSRSGEYGYPLKSRTKKGALPAQPNIHTLLYHTYSISISGPGIVIIHPLCLQILEKLFISLIIDLIPEAFKFF